MTSRYVADRVVGWGNARGRTPPMLERVRASRDDYGFLFGPRPARPEVRS